MKRVYCDNDESQGSVATHLGCGELLGNPFTTNLSFCLILKELANSANVEQSYGNTGSDDCLGLALFALQCVA